MWVKIVLLVVQTLGALLYFYGDNISFIFNHYSSVLGCGQQCINNNRIAAVICLGLALMFYHVFPSCLHKIAKHKNMDDVSTGWYSASNMMTTILKIDALFTVVAIMAQTTDFCSTTDVTISVSFFVICIVVGVSVMVVYCTIAAMELNSDSDTEKWFWIPPVTFVALLLCFPMYVLADNLQPLDCAWGCDSFATDIGNTTLTRCNTVGNSALRLGFTLTTFLVVGSLSLVLFCCRHNTKNEGVDGASAHVV